MTPGEFYQHAHQISVAMMTAVQVYCHRNGIPWDPAAFRASAPHDIEQIGKDALFYGADTFPVLETVAAPAADQAAQLTPEPVLETCP